MYLQYNLSTCFCSWLDPDGRRCLRASVMYNDLPTYCVAGVILMGVGAYVQVSAKHYLDFLSETYLNTPIFIIIAGYPPTFLPGLPVRDLPQHSHLHHHSRLPTSTCLPFFLPTWLHVYFLPSYLLIFPST